MLNGRRVVIAVVAEIRVRFGVAGGVVGGGFRAEDRLGGLDRLILGNGFRFRRGFGGRGFGLGLHTFFRRTAATLFHGRFGAFRPGGGLGLGFRLNSFILNEFGLHVFQFVGHRFSFPDRNKY